MIRNEDVEITESTDQKWTCPGQRGKSQDNRKPQRGHPAGPQEGSAGGCRADVWSRPETAGAPTLGAPGKAATGEGRGGRQPPEKFHASRFPAGWAHLSPALWEPIPQPHRDLSDFSQTSRSSPAPRCEESRLCSTSFLIISCPVVFEGLVHCLFFSCKYPPPGCQCRWIWLVQSDSSLAPCHPSSCLACLRDGGAKAVVAQGPSGITREPPGRVQQ